MRIITDEKDYDSGASVVALGMFDGVHIAHRSLINKAVRIANEKGLVCIVCTFDRHPLSVIAPEKAPKPISTAEERAAIFESLGADHTLIKHFDEEFAKVPAEKFITDIVKNLKAAYIVCGENYTFGYKGLGNIKMLESMQKELGFTLVKAESVFDNGVMVSSTLIRGLMDEGDTTRADKLLGKV